MNDLQTITPRDLQAINDCVEGSSMVAMTTAIRSALADGMPLDQILTELREYGELLVAEASETMARA